MDSPGWVSLEPHLKEIPQVQNMNRLSSKLAKGFCPIGTICGCQKYSASDSTSSALKSSR